jgi:calcium-dependent protein kinase
VGTIYTMSPQVIQGIYDSKVDLWSIGVISYMLLCTAKPFHNKSRSKMIDLILAGEYKREGAAWDGLSDNARDFVQKLLVVDAKHRMDAEQALKHPWLVEREQLPDERPSPEVLANIDNAITSYMHTSALKKLALMVIAHRSTAPAVAELRRVFEQFDTSRDGIISFEELKAAFLQCNLSDDEIQQLFASLVRFRNAGGIVLRTSRFHFLILRRREQDTNKNGRINYTEFLAATIEAQGAVSEDKIAEAFDRLDTDGTGYISKSDLRNVLGDTCSPSEIDAIVESGDINKDGKISYKEFLEVFRSNTYDRMAKVSRSPASPDITPPQTPKSIRTKIFA